MKETSRQETPLSVVGREPEPPQDGEIRARWAWVEASVWTTRMLRALETGMEEGKWFPTHRQGVVGKEPAKRAGEKLWKTDGSAGVDGRSVAAVERRSEEEISIIQRQLRAESYKPEPVKRVWIPKLGSAEKRPLGVPTVRDRIVQAALRKVIEPIFERDFAPESYGFRPGRGCKDALRRVEQLLKEGAVWVVDADIEGLLRHDSARLADGAGRAEDRRRKGAAAHRELPQSWGDGERQRLATEREWHPARGGHQSAPSQTSIWMPWIGRWPKQGCQWCVMPMTSWCSVRAGKKLWEPWRESSTSCKPMA